METSKVLLPNGYRFYEVEGHKMFGDSKEEFALENRSFFDIDMYFSQKISSAINTLLKSHSTGQIQILDLAGGTESRAVKDIEKEFENRVKALNLDFAQNIEKGKGAQRVQGNALHIPLANSSVDIVYSRQVLPFIRRFEREHSMQIKTVLSEVARVLKPGGIAFLDDEEELSGDKCGKKRQELAEEYGVVLETCDSAKQAAGERHFPKIWISDIRQRKFLLMKKL